MLLAAAILALAAVPTACFRSEPAPAVETETGSRDAVPRAIPPPVAVSEPLRAAIRKAPPSDVVDHIRKTTFTTDEDWEQFIAEGDRSARRAADRLAKRLKVEITGRELAGVRVYSLTPAEIDPANENRLFVHVHGGAYVLASGKAALPEAIVIADRADIPVVSIDYRMPPEHPFPAAVDDVAAVWRSLVEDRPARSMALGGSSAGGGLTLAATLRFKELGLELPGALFAGTPWADLSGASDSLRTNEGIDRNLVTYDGLLAGAARLYAGGQDLRHPLISPIYGEFEGFPPTHLVTGTRDLFLSDTVRVHRRMRAAGVVADLHVYEGAGHADYLYVLDSTESQQAFAELRTFLLRHLQ